MTNGTDPNKTSKYLTLNVGGSRFDTSLDTLLNVAPESTLAKIVKKEYRDLELGEPLFIDRNGSLFHHVLEFLRNPQGFVPPRDKITLERLQIEAKFFEISDLQQTISILLENYPLAIGDLVQIRCDLDAISWTHSTQSMMWAEPVTTTARHHSQERQQNGPARPATPTGNHQGHSHTNCPCKWKIKQKLKGEIRERRDFVGLRGKVTGFPHPGKCVCVSFVFQQEQDFIERECKAPLVALERID